MADELVFAKTGQHLDDLQEAVLRGTMQGEKYTQIAEEIHCNESYVRDIGSKLWQILSEELGEEVNKSNLRSTMGRFVFSNISSLENVSNFGFEKEVLAISSFNNCGEGKHSSNIQSPHNQGTANPEQSETLHHELSEMPELGNFYGREAELETLADWVAQQRSRIIAFTGISGIGKTTLAVQLVQKIQNEFDYVAWYSLETAPTFSELQDKLISFFSSPENPDSPNPSPKPFSLIKHLQKHRCLIVLDDIHQLFSSGALAGKYKSEYAEYRLFFKQIETLAHQSCLLLIGWEHPREINPLKTPNKLIRTMHLTGLDIVAGGEILKDCQLENNSYWETLIKLYQGNPAWLKSIGNLSQEMGEDFSNLFSGSTILLPEELKDSLFQQFSRLSTIEKEIIDRLASETTPINLAKLLENSPIPASDLLNGLRSLSQRSLIEKQGNLYLLPSVMKEYLFIQH